MGERIGVLGGTFDPPHIGHAIVARDVLEGLELDRMLVIPAGRPPHREHALPAAVRLGLVRKMLEGSTRLEVCDIEVARPGPSYTIDTLEQLRGERAPERLVCVIGADQLAVIDTWRDFRRIPEVAELAVMRRAGREPLPPVGVKISYITVDVTRVDLSSTRIRARLRDGRSIRYLVPETIRSEVEAAWREHVTGGAEIVEPSTETMVHWHKC